MAKEFKVISAKWVEILIPELKENSREGWEVSAYFQEHGVTKILLEKEI